MLRRTNGGRALAGTSACVGVAVACAAANVSLFGAAGVVDCANAVPQVDIIAIATSDAAVPNPM